jgi:ADP-ribosylation factor related protein 1
MFQTFLFCVSFLHSLFYRFQESLESFNKMISNEHLKGVPLLVIANKQDLDHSVHIPDIKAVFNTSAGKIGHRDCSVMAASALKGDGIDEGIEWLVKCVERNKDSRPPTLPDQ